ncbi:MAG: hypothetical protein OXM55_07825 [Bdellovibrionales bacterium]|nr:hypothetical protein [Bdellovibrionales bacterium]
MKTSKNKIAGDGFLMKLIISNKSLGYFVPVWYKRSVVFSLTVLMTITFSIASCTSLKAPQKSNLTPGIVKTKIHKGVTSQAEIVNLIGAPNIITKNKDGDEVWTYSRQSFDSASGGFAGGLLLFGGSKAFSSASSNSFDLIITFDNKNIVKDYSAVSSQF